MSPLITTELVKELRDKTGISIMQCRRALEEAGGDMNKAVAILKKTSGDIALKKNSRDARDGRVCIKTEKNKFVLVALHCETDFVAKNEDFVALLSSLADIALRGGIEKMKKNAKDIINPIIQKTGENIVLGEVYKVNGNTLGSYVHNDKIAVIVSLDGGSASLAKDMAMHIAAMQPEGIPELLDQVFIKNTEETVGQLLEKNKAKIKEVKHYSI